MRSENAQSRRTWHKFEAIEPSLLSLTGMGRYETSAGHRAGNQTTGSMPWFAAATLSRVLFLTMYMASSARCSNCALVLASLG